MKKTMVLLLSLALILMAGCGQNTKSLASSSTEPTPANNDAKEPVTIRIAHTTAETHPYHLAAVKFAELVKEKTNGRVKVEIFSSGQLGTDVEILEQTMNGELDAGLVGLSNFSGFTPVLDALQLPFLIDNYDIERKALAMPVTKELLDSLDQSLGLKGLTMFEGGMMHIATTKRKVESPSDMKGLRLRVTPSNLTRDIFTAFGSTPTPISFPEIYSALQTNVIDGAQINLSSIVSQKMHEVLGHLAILGEFPFPGVVVFNNKAFNQLSPEDQAAVQQAADEASQFNLKQMEKVDSDSLKIIKDAGVEVIELPKEQKEKFVKLTEHIYKDYSSKNPLIEKFIQEVRKLK